MPTTWLAVVLFVVVVAPGLWFDLLSEKRRAGFQESGFRETSRVILASLGFAGLAMGILAVVRTLAPAWMPDPGQVFRGKSGYDSAHYRLLARGLFIEVGIAFTFVWLFHCLLTARSGGTSIRPISAWSRAMRHEVPPGTEPAVWVRMTDGQEWMGLVHDFSADLETSGRELVLAQPLFSNPGTGFSAVTQGWQRVVLDGRSVQALSVQYWNKTANEAETVKRKRLRRLGAFITARHLA